MHKNEFNHQITTDMVPSGKACEWCSKPAEKRFTAIGGAHHNKSGAFCHSCGEKFSLVVVNSFMTTELSPCLR
jgi:hypothetical protein